MTQRSILVTGAHGRLAAAFLNWLKNSDYRAVSVTRNPQADEYGWEDLWEGNILESVTDIVHFAWSTVPYSSEQSPGIEWRIDLPILSGLLSRIAQLGPAAPRFVFISSAGTIYGDASTGPSREDDELFPRGWHGFAKLAAENLIQRFGESGVDFTILRLSNIYGVSSPLTQPQGLISYLLEALREEKPLKIWGDGSALKDYLHVDDCVAAVAEIVVLKLSGIFNIAHGKSHSVSEVIRIAEEIVGKKVKIVFSPAPKWDVHRSIPSCERIFQQISWQPTISLSQGIYSQYVGESPAAGRTLATKLQAKRVDPAAVECNHLIRFQR